MTVFDFDSYKSFIRAMIQENKSQRAYQSKLAEAIGCQKSFFSQMLGGEPHLTPDHAAKLCRYWEMSKDETLYFLNLVLHSRAGTAELKTLVRSQLDEQKARRQNPSETFKWPGLSGQPGDDLYYTSWYWGAIHMLVSVPKFHSSTAIAERLALPVATVTQALEWLEGRGLIKKEKQGWSVARLLTYLPNTSPMIEMHHSHWRMKALGNLQKQDPASLHYSSAFAIGVDDFARLKEMIVTFIGELNRQIGPSPCEELASFTCDWFRV